MSISTVAIQFQRCCDNKAEQRVSCYNAIFYFSRQFKGSDHFDSSHFEFVVDVVEGSACSDESDEGTAGDAKEIGTFTDGVDRGHIVLWGYFDQGKRIFVSVDYLVNLEKAVATADQHQILSLVDMNA